MSTGTSFLSVIYCWRMFELSKVQASAMDREYRSMEDDISDESTSHIPSKALIPVPVPGGSSGEGLPYAPEGWPDPGDVWRWKVGRRKNPSGYWHDRYLYPPARLQKAGSRIFPSRLSAEQFIRREFPDRDVNKFFSSFIWKVPYAGRPPKNDPERNMNSVASQRTLDASGHYQCRLTIKDGDCKAGNNMCSLQRKSTSCGLATKACDICCSEDDFCRDCCCILCCRTIDWAYGGYSFVRCEAFVEENYICGHVAHIECALRSYMAGTVGGYIGLDVEYYCRRCDNRTSLTSHVVKLMKTCESLDFPKDIEKVLNLGICILRGSEQSMAKNLQNRIGCILAKLRDGVCLDEIWKLEDSMPASDAGDVSHLENNTKVLGVLDTSNESISLSTGVDCSQGNETFKKRTQGPLYITTNHMNVSVKLEDEIDRVLQELKRAQESEYRIAEQKLYAHKDFLLSLYQHLDAERSAFANPTSHNPRVYDNLLTNILSRVDQIKHEETKLSHMMKIGKGFGQTPRIILTEHFGLPNTE